MLLRQRKDALPLLVCGLFFDRSPRKECAHDDPDSLCNGKPIGIDPR